MKLAIIGWYNHANYGDDRILYCLKKTFKEYDLFIVDGWEDARRKIREINQCDYILVGGGGLILGNCWRNLDVVLKFKKPFGLIGIGVEVNNNLLTNRFINTIKDRAEFILVRDRLSKERLGNHYKVIVGPDLTFLELFDVAREIKEDICGINLRDWYYWGGELYSLSYSLLKEINKRFPAIKEIYPLKKWEPDRAMNIIQKYFGNTFPIPLYFEKNAMNDVKILSKYFRNVPKQFDVNVYYKIRYLIGMRFHSIVFSVQCGIPFISLSYQPKNKAFCKDINLEELSLGLHEWEELPNKIEYLKEHWYLIKEKIIFYREEKVREIKSIFRSLLRLIK
jgi:polysaccharide pyruvyl transferase WcaK-like protein